MPGTRCCSRSTGNYNRLRGHLGYGYWSLSAWVKHRVKRAVSYIGEFEQAVAHQCRREGYAGVVCGHIHHAEIRDLEGIRYMNCGDWVESCLYGGPACIIDFGTATTFNAVTKEGEYLGGAVTAGFNLAADALFTHTAKLQRIDLQRPPSVIGRNTTHAMQSGLLYGYVSMVEGMVERFRKELGPKMKVVATGGLAEIIARETSVLEIIAPWLTLDGLRIVWDMNH